MIVGPYSSGVAVGANGAATANADTKVIVGMLGAVQIKYLDTPPATTDVIIKTKGANAPSITLLTLTDKNTDGFFPVRVEEVGNTGAGLGVYSPYLISDFINIKIDGANAGDSVQVYFYILE